MKPMDCLQHYLQENGSELLLQTGTAGDDVHRTLVWFLLWNTSFSANLAGPAMQKDDAVEWNHVSEIHSAMLRRMCSLDCSRLAAESGWKPDKDLDTQYRAQRSISQKKAQSPAA